MVAFLGARHSKEAVALLERFRVGAGAEQPGRPLEGVGAVGELITREDGANVHKLLGAFALLHFAARFAALLFGRAPMGGFGPASEPQLALGSVLAHGALSASSLRFRVPRERKPSKPMIWAEFRAHNILFGLRSVVCFAAAWRVAHAGTAAARAWAVAATSAAALLAMRAADTATARLRIDASESTTATMPYPQN